MNVLDTILQAEQKADETILKAETEAQSKLESVRKAQTEVIALERKKLAEAEAVAVAEKQVLIDKAVQKIESDTASAVAAIKQNFSAKKDGAVKAVKKYFA